MPPIGMPGPVVCTALASTGPRVAPMRAMLLAGVILASAQPAGVHIPVAARQAQLDCAGPCWRLVVSTVVMAMAMTVVATVAAALLVMAIVVSVLATLDIAMHVAVALTARPLFRLPTVLAAVPPPVLAAVPPLVRTMTAAGWVLVASVSSMVAVFVAFDQLSPVGPL